MKKIFWIYAVFMLSAARLFASADSSNSLWVRGNELYHQKQFDSAAACFEKIAANKPINAELYYNLGNTYYRLNKIGMAVLNYERALHIDPEFKDARENLILTQNRIATHIPQANEVFFISWWQSLTRGDKAVAWAVWALVIFLVIVALTMLMYFKKDSIHIPVQAPGVLGFIWLCFLVFAYFSAEKSYHSRLAVVMQNDAPFMNPEQKSGKPVSLLPEGTTVKINAIKGEYAEVTLPDGRKGWIELTWISKV